MYKASIDDWAIFPESKRNSFLQAGYVPLSCCNEWIGYVYENVDSDLDHLVDGFETLIGTDPAVVDSDCDGLADGAELPPAALPVGDPLDGPCGPSGFQILDTFSTNGAIDGRQAEVGDVTWAARPGAWAAGGRVNDVAAMGFVPFNPATLPPSSIVELSVDVGLANTEWSSVGFSSAVRPFPAAGQLWVRLFRDGTYEVRDRDRTLGQGTIPAGPSFSMHHVDIRYATSNHLATVSINGTQVLSENLEIVPNIRYSGFQMFRSAEYGGQIDNFEIFDVTSQPAALIADSFTGSGHLKGRTTEVGGVVWSGTNATFLEFNRVFDSAAIGGVPLSGVSTDEEPVVIKADVTPIGSGWIGVGFTRQPDRPLWESSELWSLIYPSGFYVVYASGGQVASGVRSPTDLIFHLELAFDPATRRATVTIDGAEVFSQVLGSKPNQQFAGFQMFGGDGFLDNFEVRSVQP